MYFPKANATAERVYSAKKKGADRSYKGQSSDQSFAFSLLQGNASTKMINLDHALLLDRPVYKPAKSTSTMTGTHKHSSPGKTTIKKQLEPAKEAEITLPYRDFAFAKGKHTSSSRHLKKVSKLQFKHPISDKQLKPVKAQSPRQSASEEVSGMILNDRYRLEEELGKGSYGRVHRCYDMLKKEELAVKEFLRGNQSQENFQFKMRNEISIMSELSHSGIARLRRYLTHKGRHFIVMEYCRGSTLKDYVRRRSELSQQEIRVVIRRVAEVVLYCHSQHIAHRDIKVENIMLCQQASSIKLIDFGFSVRAAEGQQVRSFCGTPLYMSPEITKRSCYNPYLADSWALGVVIFYMLTKRHPFIGTKESLLFHSIRDTEPTYPQKISQQMRVALQGLLRKRSEERLTVKQFLDSGWMRLDEVEQ